MTTTTTTVCDRRGYTWKRKRRHGGTAQKNHGDAAAATKLKYTSIVPQCYSEVKKGTVPSGIESYAMVQCAMLWYSSCRPRSMEVVVVVVVVVVPTKFMND